MSLGVDSAADARSRASRSCSPRVGRGVRRLGAPRGRELDIPGRKDAAKNIHIGIDWLSCVWFGDVTKIGDAVIVLGGGNTAMVAPAPRAASAARR